MPQCVVWKHAIVLVFETAFSEKFRAVLICLGMWQGKSLLARPFDIAAAAAAARGPVGLTCIVGFVHI
jgi:hypothetical protein